MSDIKWNIKRHDEHVSDTEKSKVKTKIGDIYENWRKGIGKAVRSSKDLRLSLIGLKESVLREAAKHDGMADWIEFTSQIVDEKIQLIEKEGANPTNRITLFREERTHMPVEEYTFSTREEMVELPIIKEVKATEGFQGFAVHNFILFAVYEDGTVNAVGHLRSYRGLDHLPTLGDVHRALDSVREKVKEVEDE